MTEEMIALARRAVACKNWKWMPGMAGTDALGVPFRCALTHHSGGMMVVAGMAFMPAHPDALARMFPDLSDPATLGCLLHLVREAYADPLISTVYDSAYWFVEHPEGMLSQNNTEAEALVSALEAAP